MITSDNSWQLQINHDNPWQERDQSLQSLEKSRDLQLKVVNTNNWWNIEASPKIVLQKGWQVVKMRDKSFIEVSVVAQCCASVQESKISWPVKQIQHKSKTDSKNTKN